MLLISSLFITKNNELASASLQNNTIGQFSIFSVEFCFCLVWLQTKMLNEFTILIDQTILNFHPSHQTIQCSQSSHRALCRAVCTVQRGALYGLQWCAVYALQSAMVCAARPLHIPNFCGGHYYIVNVHYTD